MYNRVAFRADDFGLCEPVNLGILDVVTTGVVKNVSMQVNGLAVEHAATMVREQMPHVCLGIHVSLNCEWTTHQICPLLPARSVPTLVDDRGVFLPSPNHFHDRKASVPEMLTETARQLARFHELGLKPKYMDAHMGVSWVHDWSDPLFSRRLKDGLLDLCRAFKLVWIDDVPSLALTADLIRTRLENPAHLVKVVTHPAIDTPQMRSFALAHVGGDALAAQRDGDRQQLTSNWLIDAVQSGKIQSVSFVD